MSQAAAGGSAEEDLRAGPQQAPDSPAYAQTITATPARPVPPPPAGPGEGRGGGAVLPGAADQGVFRVGSPPPVQAPPGRAAPARRPRRPAVGRPLAVALAVLVVAGGAAAGLLLTRHPAHSRLSASQSQVSPQDRITLAPTTAPSTAGTTTAPSPPQPPPTQMSSQGVTIGIGAVNTDPDAITVADTLAAYFGGINTRNYTQAWDTFTPSMQAGSSLQSFSTEDSTSRDSQVMVQSLQHGANGDIDAEVTFQSHQAGQYGPTPGQTCTNWSLDYQLVPSSGGQPSPSGAAPLSYLINKVKTVGTGPASC
jgi:eukaryotic-like serine/threonine-protein kinase